MNKKKSISIILLAVVVTIMSIAITFYINNIANGDFAGVVISFLGGFAGMAISMISLEISKMINKNKGNIFISYSYKDKEFADRLIASLRDKCFNVIFDREIIGVGDNIESVISDNITKSDLMIVILSNSINKKYRDMEIKYAIDNKKKILPVHTGSKKTKIPEVLKDIKYADFSQGYDNGIRDLTQSMAVTLGIK